MIVLGTPCPPNSIDVAKEKLVHGRRYHNRSLIGSWLGWAGAFAVLWLDRWAMRIPANRFDFRFSLRPTPPGWGRAASDCHGLPPREIFLKMNWKI